MNDMKTKYALLALFAIVACEQLETNIVNKESTVKMVENSTLNDIAVILTDIDIDIPLCREVLQSVQQSVDKGMDENLYFKELWMNPMDVKVRSLGEESILKKRLDEYFNNQLPTRSSDTENAVKNSDIRLYWPYSENWDGITMPVIAPAPRVESDAFYGYKYNKNPDGEFEIEIVLIDDDYAYDNPVWIINYMETPYDAISDYSYINKDDLSTRSTGNRYLWEMDRMLVTKQYDKLSNGGSEFDVFVTYPLIDGYAVGQCHQFYTFTRAQIRNAKNNDVAVIINSDSRLLNTDWSSVQLSNHFALYENDGGDASQTVNAGTVGWKDDKTGLSASLTVTHTVKSNDKSLLQVNYTRDYYLPLPNDTKHSISDGTVSWYTNITKY